MTFSTFHEMPLSRELLNTLTRLGFETPSPIQQQAIPLLLEGNDILGLAETGTGKTAAFAIPIIEKIKPKSRYPQTLILCPTRELATQVSVAVDQLLVHIPNVKSTALVGGESINKQLRAVKRNPVILVGTPGRVLDMIRQGMIRLSSVRHVVLDEADEMLDMGFRPDIERIFSELPSKRQTILMSATMSSSIQNLAKKVLHHPQYVKTAEENASSKNVHQHYVAVPHEGRRQILSELILREKLFKGIIFCNTKRQVDKLSGLLQQDGLNANGLHGGMSQSQRNRVMKNFRLGKTSFLVATDVAARGIDVKDVDSVLNYDFPLSNESYVHRIGRTGRASQLGKSYTFVSRRQQKTIKQLEKLTNSSIHQLTVTGL